MITQCEYCDAVIEYDSSDYNIAFGSGLDGIYITCPACGKMVIVGAVNL